MGESGGSISEDQFKELEDRAKNILMEAVYDSSCNWNFLSNDEREIIKERCNRLFSYFSRTPPEALSDLSSLLGVPDRDENTGELCYNPDLTPYVLERYQETTSLDFHGEFDMTEDQVLVTLLAAIQEEKNVVNIDFTPICEAANLDCGTYHLVKIFLRKEDHDHTARNLIQQVFCTPLDACINLTMALCEVSRWPMMIDWKRIEYEELEFTPAHLDCLDAIVESASRERRQNTGNPEQQRISEAICNQLCSDLESLQVAAKTNQDLIKSETEDCLKNSSADVDQLNRDRNQDIVELCPDVLRIRELLSVSEAQAIENEIADAKSAMQVLMDANSDAKLTVTLADKLKLELGMMCFVRTFVCDEKVFKGAVFKHYTDNRPPEPMCRVQFFGQDRDCIVAVSDIANVNCRIFDIERYNLIGLRVVALARKPFGGTDWCVGTVAADPVLQGNEFLILFDEDFEGYVKAPLQSTDDEAVKLLELPNYEDYFLDRIQLLKVIPMCTQSFDAQEKCINRGAVYKLIPAERERHSFIKRYFEQFPTYGLARFKKPVDGIAQATIASDYNGQRRQAYVVHIDRSMCVLRFVPRDGNSPGFHCHHYPCETHEHADEWVFRGSLRIRAVAQEHSGGNHNMSSRRLAKTRIMLDAIEPERRAPNAMTILTVEPPAVVARKSSNVSYGFTTDYRTKSAENARLAAKRREVTVDQKKQKENEYSITQLEHPVIPESPIVYHDECTEQCLRSMDRNPDIKGEFNYCSPLFIPIFCGWLRQTYSYKTIKKTQKGKKRPIDERILYRAPCGRTFSTLDLLGDYIRSTKCQLAIDLFSFDPEINVFSYVESPKKSVKMVDYSNNMERIPIAAVNTIDDEYPPKLEYCVRRFAYDNRVDVSTISREFCSGCSCIDDCSDASKCECRQLTESSHFRLALNVRSKTFGYEYLKLQDKTLSGIFECNDNCGCAKSQCYNRLIQRNMRYPLQLFKTAQCGWGVRSLVDIPRGTFVAHYIGALMTDGIANELTKGDDSYFADLDLSDVVETEKANAMVRFGNLDLGIGPSDEEPDATPDRDSDDAGLGKSEGESDDDGLKKRLRRRAAPKQKKKEVVAKKRPVVPVDGTVFKWNDYFGEKEALYVLDAKKRGNIGRFFNHSCDPNMLVQNALVDTHDLRLPWTAFFTSRNIKAGEELLWNYGYSPDMLDLERPEDLQVHCHCGSSYCQGRLI